MSCLGPGSGPIASSSQLCLRACVGRDGSERPCHLVVPGPFCRLCSQSPQTGYHCHSKFWMCELEPYLPSSSLHSLTMQRDSTSSTSDE